MLRPGVRRGNGRFFSGFVDQSKKAVRTIDNPAKAQGVYRSHATILPTEDAADKSVHIDSIAEAK